MCYLTRPIHNDTLHAQKKNNYTKRRKLKCNVSHCECQKTYLKMRES